MTPQWKDQGYNCYVLATGIVTISVSWHSATKDVSSGYGYSYGNYRSSKLYPDLVSAQNAAMKAVHKRITDALTLLESITP